MEQQTIFKFFGSGNNDNSKKPKRSLELQHDTGNETDNKITKTTRGIPANWPPTKYSDWLVCDRDKELIFCKICTEFGRQIGKDGKINQFVVGSKGFRTSKLEAHELNNEHLDALRAKYAVNNPGKSVLERGIVTLNEKETEHLCKLFKTAYHLAHREMPFTEFEQLLKLQSVNFDVDLTSNYASDKQAKIFIEYIAKDLTNDIIMKQSGFFTVLCDGSTDSSVIEEEIIYLRYIDQTEMKPVTRYLCMRGVEKADANGIYSAINDGLVEVGGHDNWKDNVVGFTSDGAPVMMGKKGGVAAKLKQDVPHVIAIPCVSHTLELAIKDSCKNNSLQTNCDATLQNIYKFYHYSPLNLNGLFETGHALDIDVKTPVNIMGTRWANHRLRAIKTVLHNWAAIVTHCSQVHISNKGDSSAKAKNILDNLKSLEFLIYLFLMRFFFEVCAMLSDCFQDNNTSVDLIPVRMNAACLKLTETDIGALADKFVNEELVDRQYKGIKLEAKRGRGHTSSSATIIKKVVSEVKSTAAKTAEALYARIHEFEGNGSLLEAFHIFSPVNWPEEKVSFGTYGTSEVAEITTHFADILQRQGIDKDACIAELPDLLLEASCLMRRNKDLTY